MSHWTQQRNHKSLTEGFHSFVNERSKREAWHLCYSFYAWLSLCRSNVSVAGLFTQQISVSLVPEKLIKSKFLFFWLSLAHCHYLSHDCITLMQFGFSFGHLGATLSYSSMLMPLENLNKPVWKGLQVVLTDYEESSPTAVGDGRLPAV